jgi:hypothetical protein
MLTEQDIRDRLRAAIKQAGSQAAFARQHNISLQYINDVMNGRRDMGQKILDALGIEKIVTYRERSDVSDR